MISGWFFGPLSLRVDVSSSSSGGEVDVRSGVGVMALWCKKGQTVDWCIVRQILQHYRCNPRCYGTYRGSVLVPTALYCSCTFLPYFYTTLHPCDHSSYAVPSASITNRFHGETAHQTRWLYLSFYTEHCNIKSNSRQNRLQITHW